MTERPGLDFSSPGNKKTSSASPHYSLKNRNLFQYLIRGLFYLLLRIKQTSPKI